MPKTTETTDGWQIDPKNITNFKADDFELELMILFWVLAAGKNGVTASNCLRKMLTYWAAKITIALPYPGNENFTPFDVIRFILDEGVDLAQEMKQFGIGCFNNKAKTFKVLVESNLNLKTCSVDDLEKVPGIGNKSSRCFLIHSRPNQVYAGLDRHVLAYMRDQGHSVPKSTPTGKKYKEIEQQFINIVTSQGRTIADLDLEIWNSYRSRFKK